jgi:hypothetical protein
MTSKADLKRYDALQRYGCVACRIDGCHSLGDIHHIVDKGYRKHSGGNQSTFVLCQYHHRGVLPPGHTVASACLAFGPSLRHQSKLFHKIYGTQRELLAKVNAAIAPKEIA